MPYKNLHIFFSTDIFFTTFRQIEVSAKTFRGKLSRKRDEILRKVTPCVKVFVFAKGQKSVFVPTLIHIIVLQNGTRYVQRYTFHSRTCILYLYLRMHKEISETKTRKFYN
jgi:hypothetical protein